MKRIHESLHRVLGRNRLVFWYDPTSEWSEAFDSLEDDTVTQLRVTANEFATKVRIVRDPNPDAKFLVYVPGPRPADSENWLLDLLLQGHEFRADKASLILEDMGLPFQYRSLVEDHSAFFKSARRVQAVRELLVESDEAKDIRLKMMAVLAGTSAVIDDLLLAFLHRGADGGLLDPVDEVLGGSGLVEPFWREVGSTFGYHAEAPSLRDLAVWLFRAANPLDPMVILHPHSKVFLRRWQDSQKCCESFRTWSRQLENELQVRAALEALDRRATLGEWDTFELFEKFILHRLCGEFGKGAPAVELRSNMEQRRQSFWYTEHSHGYSALDHAIELRESLAAAELAMESVAEGVTRYGASWWRIDHAYRRCAYHLRQYGQVQLMEQVRQWVEKTYVNNYLLPLGDRWGDRVGALQRWSCEGLPAQRGFFQTYVQPFLDRGQKIFEYKQG